MTDDNFDSEAAASPRKEKGDTQPLVDTYHADSALDDGEASEQVEEQAVLPSGTVLDGRYLIEEEIGRGGMGVVLRGQHLTLGIPVAIKVMLPEAVSKPHYLRRFRREARSMSGLRHRNIASVLDYGDFDGAPYMVMEYLQGLTLGDFLDQSDDFPKLTRVRDIMLDIINAMEAAHRSSVVHRDLKPDNIFLTTESDGKLLAKVLDFGLAKLLEPEANDVRLTEVGLVAGTPAYMSPEQCRGMEVGPSTDIYALGCLLTELLQLKPPFTGESAAELMAKHLYQTPPPLDRQGAGEPLPMSLEKFRLELLSKSPEQRPSSMSRVRTRLIDCLPEETGISRSSIPPVGTRDSRTQAAWESTDGRGFLDSVPPPGSSSESAAWPNPYRPKLCVINLSGAESVFGEEMTIGLRMHGFKLTHMSPETFHSQTFDLFIIEAGSATKEAGEWLGAQKWSGAATILIGQSIAMHLPELIAAGVGDVVSMPCDSAILARKVTRLLAEAEAHRNATGRPPPMDQPLRLFPEGPLVG